MANDIIRLDWGLLDYAQALERMRQRHQDRVAGLVEDAIICVEHPRVFTLGRQGGRENILLSDQELAQQGFAVYQVERAGDVTYHGPGQAVVYPVVDLKARRIGVRALLEAVAGSIVQVASQYGLAANYDQDQPGIWVQGRKLAAIGLALPQKVTMHGLAMNVNSNLDDFKLIKACGLEVETTSLAKELDRPVALDEVYDRLYQALLERLAQAEGTLAPDKEA